jgi:hypothetical protein
VCERCNPVTQKLCSSMGNAKCGVDSSLDLACIKKGTNADNQPCTASSLGDSCKSGLHCSVKTKLCHYFCDPSKGDADCPANQACTLTVDGTSPPVSICAHEVLPCHPLLQDCPVKSHGCFYTTDTELCLPAGSVPDGSACMVPNDCQVGSTCIGISGGGGPNYRCRRLCNLGGGEPSCGVGTTCQVLEADFVGYCYPPP